MSRFHALSIVDIKRETRDAVSIQFAVPDALRSTFDFTPGQYLTLRTMIDDEDIRRSYSICSGREDGTLRIGVRKVAGGAMSAYLNDALRQGDTLDVMPPQGRFALQESASPRHVLGIAAGSGITPILSIMRTLLASEPDSRFTLIYGNQRSSSVMFAEDIEDLKNRHLGRLSVVHVLSREAQDITLLSGRITAEKLAELGAGVVDLSTIDAAYLCGPEGMISASRKALQDQGLAASAIHSELFTPAQPRKSKPKVDAAASAVAVAEITVTLDGRAQSFPLLASDTSLIEAAAREGLDLPYSCAGGMCCTCRCKIEQGEADLAVNYSLEPWEIEAGFTLACQARPKGKTLSLNFDAL
jgi:ring-1,2-phenylacetyl-CoA epoxidase subunit PaaE